MTEPNRLTAPGEIAARTRVEALFARIDELGPDMLVLPVPGFDLEARESRSTSSRPWPTATDGARCWTRHGSASGTGSRPGWSRGIPAIPSGHR